MPNAEGQFQLQDFVTELINRGFDGFSNADLKTFVNRGYFHVARKAPWYWEQSTDEFTITQGQHSVELWPITGGELPYFSSLDKLYMTTAGKEMRIKPMRDDTFFEGWLYKDLTNPQFRGEPTEYYVFEGKLYLLSPPIGDRTFRAHFHRQVALLKQDDDVPITPVTLDEAIVLAALIRAHKRANEPTLVAVTQAELEEFFDDMRDDEEMRMAEQPDRMLPDNTWL
jgi:hypothetical protein